MAGSSVNSHEVEHGARYQVGRQARFWKIAYISDRKTCTENIESAVELLQLEPYRKQLAANLSGGWRQRLALACAVVHHPRIIFLDEPTAGIDPVSRRVLWDFLYELSHEGITLFVTTHYMEEAERCNRIGFIWEGNLVACSTPDGVKKGFIKDHILTLKCSEINRAYKIVKTAESVKDANLYGDEIHITVDNSQRMIPVLKETLLNSKINITELRQIQPSIEDVFVTLSNEEKDGSKDQRLNP